MELPRDDEETICALATGWQSSAVSLIRVSGSRAHGSVLACLPGFFLKQEHFRQALVKDFCDPKNQEWLDKPLILFFKGPASYTGEDVVELHLHGGPYLTSRVLKALETLGVRAAEPGEFTRRAYLNGKLDLASAEGIHGLITAETRQEWLSAQSLARGELSHWVEKLRESLMESWAYLETLIDFPEEPDTAQISFQDISRGIERALNSLQKLTQTYVHGKVAAQGLKVAIVGPPNSGKSSFFNKILGYERAMVSPVPGTTRDFLREDCFLKGRRISLMDTAGLRESHDPLEVMGMDHSRRLAKEADLVLAFCPGDGDFLQISKFQNWIQSQNFREVLFYKTKDDMASSWQDPLCQSLSLLQGDSFQKLCELLIKKVDGHLELLNENSLFISSPRHYESLLKAEEHLESFLKALSSSSGSEEILSLSLKEALGALGQIIGHVNQEDLLDVIFSRFCMGK